MRFFLADIRNVILIFLSLLLTCSISNAQNRAISPELAEKGRALFPDIEGELEVFFRADVRMHAFGYEIMYYAAATPDKEVVGDFARITSIFPEDAAAPLDVVVRFDDEGKLVSSMNMVGSGDSAADGPVQAALTALQGQDVRTYEEPINQLLNGLLMASKVKDVEPPKRSASGGVTLDLRGKILEGGAALPKFSVTDIDGFTIDNQTLQGKRSLMVFTDTTCDPCDEMHAQLEENATIAPSASLSEIITIYGDSEEGVRTVMERHGRKLPAVADPERKLFEQFKIPFTPYILAFAEDGKLAFPLYWKDPNRFRGAFFSFIENVDPASVVPGEQFELAKREIRDGMLVLDLPEIEAVDVDGRPFATTDLDGKSSALIFLNVEDPASAEFAAYLRDVESNQEFLKGRGGEINLVTFLLGPNAAATAFRDTHELPGRVIADPGGRIARQFRSVRQLPKLAIVNNEPRLLFLVPLQDEKFLFGPLSFLLFGPSDEDVEEKPQ